MDNSHDKNPYFDPTFGTNKDKLEVVGVVVTCVLLIALVACLCWVGSTLL